MHKVLKTIGRAYMISGDMNGDYGRRNNEIRKVNMYMKSDGYQIAEDWEKTGLDMQVALGDFSERRRLNHG